MFGTLKPAYNERNSDVKDIYKLYYCGLCSSLGRMGGPLLRMGLSYDVAFMYLLLDAERRREISKCACPSRFMLKKNCVDSRPLADYMAVVSLALIHGKGLDDINDRENVLLSRAAVGFTRRKLEKAVAEHADVLDLISVGIAEINEMEKNFADRSFVDVADRFGKIVGELFRRAPGIGDADVFYRMGYWLGRWICIADAAADIPKDMKKRRFNPFTQGEAGTPHQVFLKHRDEIAEELIKAQNCVADAIKLVDTYNDNKETEELVSRAMQAAAGNIFKMQEEIGNAKQ